MVMVLGERKLELTLTVLETYIVPYTACQLAKRGAKGSKHVITRSKMGAGQFQNWLTM